MVSRLQVFSSTLARKSESYANDERNLKHQFLVLRFQCWLVGRIACALTLQKKKKLQDD